MDEYKRHLQRLAVHDDALLDEIVVEGSRCGEPVIDEKTATLMRLAATIAVDAAPASFQRAVALALAAGATSNEIVAGLEAVTPVTRRPVRPQGRARAGLRRRGRARDPRSVRAELCRA